MEQEMILKLQNIRKNFGGIQALKDVSLSLKKGEVHALLQTQNILLYFSLLTILQQKLQEKHPLLL